MGALTFLGRVLFSVIFIIMAYHNLGNLDDTVHKMQGVQDLAARCEVRNVAVVPAEYQLIAAYAANSLGLIGGLLLATSLQPKLGAFLLLAFLIPVTFFQHYIPLKIAQASTLAECNARATNDFVRVMRCSDYAPNTLNTLLLLLF